MQRSKAGQSSSYNRCNRDPNVDDFYYSSLFLPITGFATSFYTEQARRVEGCGGRGGRGEVVWLVPWDDSTSLHRMRILPCLRASWFFTFNSSPPPPRAKRQSGERKADLAPEAKARRDPKGEEGGGSEAVEIQILALRNKREKREPHLSFYHPLSLSIRYQHHEDYRFCPRIFGPRWSSLRAAEWLELFHQRHYQCGRRHYERRRW